VGLPKSSLLLQEIPLDVQPHGYTLGLDGLERSAERRDPSGQCLLEWRVVSCPTVHTTDTVDIAPIEHVEILDPPKLLLALFPGIQQAIGPGFPVIERTLQLGAIITNLCWLLQLKI